MLKKIMNIIGLVIDTVFTTVFLILFWLFMIAGIVSNSTGWILMVVFILPITIGIITTSKEAIKTARKL